MRGVICCAVLNEQCGVDEAQPYAAHYLLLGHVKVCSGQEMYETCEPPNCSQSALANFLAHHVEQLPVDHTL